MLMRLLALCSIGLNVAAEAVMAQHAAALKAGARVRVWGPAWRDEALTGTLVSFAGDTLLLQAQGKADTLRVPRSGVTRLDVSRGSASRVGAGIKHGVIVGVIVGTVAGAAWCAAEYSCSSDEDAGANTLVAAFTGALVGLGSGLVVGAAVGAARSGERWETVPF